MKIKVFYIIIRTKKKFFSPLSAPLFIYFTNIIFDF